MSWTTGFKDQSGNTTAVMRVDAAREIDKLASELLAEAESADPSAQDRNLLVLQVAQAKTAAKHLLSAIHPKYPWVQVHLSGHVNQHDGSSLDYVTVSVSGVDVAPPPPAQAVVPENSQAVPASESEQAASESEQTAAGLELPQGDI